MLGNQNAGGCVSDMPAAFPILETRNAPKSESTKIKDSGMRHDTECKEAAERLFTRIHGHLLAIRDTINLPMADAALADENDALLSALEVGDAMKVESALYDIDHECEDDE